MTLSIIIVNWNSQDYVRKCLESIRANILHLAVEIIVVDSGSRDGCGEMLAIEFPSVTFIQGEKNLGFAGANNIGLLAATGESILFLNPDTELVGCAINALHDALWNLPNAGIVGAKLLNSDGSLQTSSVQAFPTILNQLLNAEILRMRFARARLWGMAALFESSSKPAEVEAISGACMMIKRSFLNEIGPFCTDFFMYSEDVELSLRSRRAGATNYYVPNAVIIHHGGSSSAKSEVSTFASVMMLESRWRYFRKTRSAAYGFLYRAGIVGLSLVRVSLTLALWPVGVLRGQRARWTASGKKWWARFRWALGLERWVKQYGA